MKKIERHCNECGDELNSSIGGFIVCRGCGLVHDIILDDRDHPLLIVDGERFKSSEQHGGKILHSTPHISSTLKQYIPERFKDSRIGKLLKRYDYVSRDVIKTKHVFSELKAICNKYSMVKHLYSHCCHFYKRIKNDLEFRGQGVRTELIAWLIVYCQCRIFGIPFNLSFLRSTTVGLSNKEVKIVRKRFFFLKEKFNIKIYDAGINKSLWYFLGVYVKEPRLRTLLQKNILKLITNKYQHFNVLQKRILVASILYVLLKKFKYEKITYKDLSKRSGISVDALYKYTKILKK